jgi:hypothetical protein
MLCVAFFIDMLNDVMQIIIFAECLQAESIYADCRYAECNL